MIAFYSRAVPTGLSQFALSFFTNREAALKALTVPVLVWELPSGPNPEESWQHTATGAGMARPRVAEPLVYRVEKVSGKKNAFAMGVTLGRVDTNDLQADDASVSRFHAYFQRDEKAGTWSVTDAESHNGTSLDGVRLKPNVKTVLHAGTRVRFGDVEMLFLTPEAFVEFLDARTSGADGRAPTKPL
jgi:hypothetical protein